MTGYGLRPGLSPIFRRAFQFDVVRQELTRRRWPYISVFGDAAPGADTGLGTQLA